MIQYYFMDTKGNNTLAIDLVSIFHIIRILNVLKRFIVINHTRSEILLNSSLYYFT